MKKTVMIALAICLIVVVAASCSAEVTNSGGQNATVQMSAQESTITVNATESVKVTPDVAYAYIGVETKGKTAEEAQQENADIVETFLKALKTEGVADEDIETSNFNIYEDYETPGQYVVSNTYKVTIRDINKTGTVIDAAVSAGANQSYSLSFDILDRDSVYLEALGIAMKSIGEKAEAVAQAGGYSIVRPLSIEESGSSGYYYADEMVAEAAAMDTGSAGTNVTPGEIEVSASVSGKYVIE